MDGVDSHRMSYLANFLLQIGHSSQEFDMQRYTVLCGFATREKGMGKWGTHSFECEYFSNEAWRVRCLL